MQDSSSTCDSCWQVPFNIMDYTCFKMPGENRCLCLFGALPGAKMLGKYRKVLLSQSHCSPAMKLVVFIQSLGCCLLHSSTKSPQGFHQLERKMTSWLQYELKNTHTVENRPSALSRLGCLSFWSEFSVFADIVISCFCDLRIHRLEAGSSMCPYDCTHLSQPPTGGQSRSSLAPLLGSYPLSFSQVIVQLWKPQGEKHFAFSHHPRLLRPEALIWKALPHRHFLLLATFTYPLRSSPSQS